eukprot:scaffold3267_cov140-Cylindrotheca_fusiformis.AAC.18
METSSRRGNPQQQQQSHISTATQSSPESTDYSWPVKVDVWMYLSIGVDVGHSSHSLLLRRHLSNNKQQKREARVVHEMRVVQQDDNTGEVAAAPKKREQKICLTTLMAGF